MPGGKEDDKYLRCRNVSNEEEEGFLLASRQSENEEGRKSKTRFRLSMRRCFV